MSLLRNVLKRNQHPPDADTPLPATSKRSVKRYAASIKSSGGASIRSMAESMLSFYSVMTGGGTRVPKRRRADFSKLGVPEWHAENPPPPPLMPGTAAASPPPAFTSGTAYTLYVPNDSKPWLGLVLYSHARPESKMAMYHNAAIITGEVRVVLDAPANLRSIDVWVVISSDSAADSFKPPIRSMTVNVWNRKKGDPRSTAPDERPFTGKFPAGSFVFPFEFPALEEDTLVKHPDNTQRKNMARVPFPPTYFVSKPSGFWGTMKYIAGVNYMPLCKPLPRVKTPFPYIPTREDWPLDREVLGGWILSPFGGRGRLGEEMVEIEGILGIQEPAVYTAGQILEFSLLLWSANPRALEALGQPGAVEVGLYKADVFSANALDPRSASRRDRYTSQLTTGRAWRTDNGRPADDAPVPAVEEVTLPDVPTRGAGHKVSPLASGESHHVKGKVPSRMQEVHAADDEDEGTLVEDTAALRVGGETPDAVDETLVGKQRTPSPTPSLDDLDAEDPHETDHFMRLDGEVRVPACSHPSFRYTHMGREYFLNLLIRHPQYVHISPREGLIAEVPVWYVVDRFAHLPPSAAAKQMSDFGALPVSGTVVPVGLDAVRAPVSVGAYTEEKRPTSKFARMR
ncbi:hypothetical protein MVEN_02630400 [Mycena venus]|uniref:Uncharacterized protein n=1 Tax=Mycena venus TaxID=2733690 RepID=A0A8H6TYL3_9AGAR|nr:hypothetical protein MVEN_02630400 [Mycena venus]